MIETLNFMDFIKDDSYAYIGDLLLKQNEYTTIHNHNFFEVFIVENGCFIHNCNGVKTTLKKGMGKFIKPSDSHNFIGSNEFENNKLRNIAISPQTFKSILKFADLKIDNSFFNEFTLNEHILYQFNYKTIKFIEEKNILYKNFLLQSIMGDLIINILDNYNINKNIPKWLQELYQDMQIENNVLEGLPKLIKLSNRSQEHTIREFKKYYGLTPTDFINETRLKKSARLLLETDLHIIDISEKCGFNTLTYYNKLFKKYYGCSPSDYRKRNQKIFFKNINIL